MFFSFHNCTGLGQRVDNAVHLINRYQLFEVRIKLSARYISIRWITPYLLLSLIHWIAIYLLDNVSRLLHNWTQADSAVRSVTATLDSCVRSRYTSFEHLGPDPSPNLSFPTSTASVTHVPVKVFKDYVAVGLLSLVQSLLFQTSF